MQACTWNLQGKQLTSASDYIHLSFDPEIILLQEVGSTADLPSAPNGATGGADPGVREVSLGLEHDLFHHRVFCGHNESHLAQVIAIDSDIVQKVLFTHTGLRFVAVGFFYAARPIVIRSLFLRICHIVVVARRSMYVHVKTSFPLFPGILSMIVYLVETGTANHTMIGRITCLSH